MIIDSSAILTVIGKEPGYKRIIHQLAASPGTRIGAPTRVETGIVLTAPFGARGKTALARFLQENSASEPLACYRSQVNGPFHAEWKAITARHAS